MLFVNKMLFLTSSCCLPSIMYVTIMIANHVITSNGRANAGFKEIKAEPV